MRFFLLVIIRIYWFLIPKAKRRKCIFRKSCSQFVYEKTIENGFYNGWKSLIFRYRNCRPGHEIFQNPIDDTFQMILPNGEIIDQTDIAVRLTKKEE